MPKLRIVATSDTHNNYPEIRPCNIFVHAGDLTARGSTEELDRAVDWLLSIQAEYKVVVAGNHDFGIEKGYVLPKEIIYLNNSGHIIEGLSFWGSPITPLFNNWSHMLPRAEMHKIWEEMPYNLDVLVTHGPPADIMDRTGTDHAGCSSLLNSVLEKQPRLHIFGHIHESYGRVHTKHTIFANVSFVGVDESGRPRHANPPQVFDWLI